MGDVVRIDRLAKAKPDEDASDSDTLLRLAQAAQAFSDMRKDDFIASYATEGGGVNGVTYGDIAALVRIYLDQDERLVRIATWHSREKRSGGLVGNRCDDCGLPWPCDTWLMATGQYVDEGLYDA